MPRPAALPYGAHIANRHVSNPRSGCTNESLASTIGLVAMSVALGAWNRNSYSYVAFERCGQESRSVRCSDTISVRPVSRRVTMHSKRSALVAAAAVLVLAACGATTRSAGPSGGSGAADLQVTKDCSEAMGAAGDVCTITASNHEAIQVGSRLVFASASGPDFLDSDIVLDVSPGNFAMGHCTTLRPAAGSARSQKGPGILRVSTRVSTWRRTHRIPRYITGPGRTAPAAATNPATA